MKYLVLLLLLVSSLVAEKTLCYKNNLASSVENKETLLDGGKCQKIFSVNDMVKNGWKIDDYKVITKDNKFNHLYVFSRKSSLDKLFEQGFIAQNVKLQPREFKKNELLIYDVTDTTAKVKVGNLKIGQSGVVVNNISGNYTIITQGSVIKTAKDHSVIQFVESKLLKQDAIPTLKLKPTNSDLFVLNHLYKSSLLIVPNLNAKKFIKKNFPEQNFLSEDFFATYLKINNNPVPTKKDIIDFCSMQELGTVFIVVKNKLYVIDALSFKTIDEINVPINSASTQLPFHTRITKIETGFFNFGATNIGSYNEFYTSLIKNTGYAPKVADSDPVKKFLRKVTEYLPW